MHVKINRNSLGQFKQRRARFLHISQSYTRNGKGEIVATNVDFYGHPCGVTYNMGRNALKRAGSIHRW